jgi:hypothetical protein
MRHRDSKKVTKSSKENLSKGELGIKDEVRKKFLVFREYCGHNTSIILSYLNFMKDDGLLKYLHGMDGITNFEATIIEDLLKGMVKNDCSDLVEVKHPLPKEKYSIERYSFRVSENHPWAYLFKYCNDNIYSVKGMNEEEAYSEFCKVCKKYETSTYK